MSPREREDKIRALLDSPIEGERQAAQAALSRTLKGRESVSRKPDRFPPKQPQNGTPEWLDLVLEYHRRIEFCVSRLSSPHLQPHEVTSVRNIARYRGNPWDRGASTLLPIYEKLAARSSV